jgi:hypothetical protein
MDKGLKEDIKFNCDLSDALYWGYFSICGLLLRYRDLYRSEKGLKAWANISRTDIAAWIESKEASWPHLENQQFRDLAVDGRTFGPFEVDGINEMLAPKGLVYGAGYSMYMKPSFFLAELRSTRQVDGLTVMTSGPELVRDLLTSSAMLQGNSVFLRLEPLMMLLHFKFGELNTKSDPLLEEAFSHYGFSERQLMDETFEKRLQALAEAYAEIVIAHEVGEHREGVPEWKDILTAAGDRKNEHYLRAIKDLLADTSEAGPLRKIVETKDRGALGLWVALREGFPRVMFPEIRQAVQEFRSYGNWDVLEKTRKAGHERFHAERERVLELFRECGKDMFAGRLRALIASS